jgi:hypothetical protein
MSSAFRIVKRQPESRVYCVRGNPSRILNVDSHVREMASLGITNLGSSRGGKQNLRTPALHRKANNETRIGLKKFMFHNSAK